MRRLIEWLLDLENIRLGRDAPLLLRWENRIEPWLWVGCALIGLLLIAAAYRRERLSPTRRISLATIRFLLLVLVGTVLCEPSLMLQRNRVETSHVALVIDRSASMATRESYADEALAAAVARGAGLDDARATAKTSRLELVRRSLLKDDAAALRRLLDRNAVQLYSFAGAAEPLALASSPSELAALTDPLGAIESNGTTTDLGGTISGVLEQSQGRRLAAVVLATDGRTTEPTGLEDGLDLARGRQIPIYPLRVGSPHARSDIDVGPVRAEANVYVHDLLPVEVQVSSQGLAEPTTIPVVLILDGTETVAASRLVTLPPGRSTMTVELVVKPTQTGRVRYRAEVKPLPGEQTTENNVERVEVMVLGDRLRVLYVEGYPRYEYRYLKNALLREETVDLSVLLIEADDHFVQEGTDPIRRFPETAEELNRFDVVLLGDVNPRAGWLTAAQMNLLLDFVGNEGGGFGLIAGERAAPHGFVGTPLEKLIPVRIDPEFTGQYESSLTTGFRPQLTVEGRRSRLFAEAAPNTPATADDGALDHTATTDERLFETLPELFWFARTLGVKPGASVLACHPTLRTLAERPGALDLMPLIAVSRYGAGKILFQASDDTWRWRALRVGGLPAGEWLHDAYWVAAVRLLAQPQRAAQDRRFVIRTDARAYPYGQPVHVQVELIDSQLVAERRDSLALVLLDRSGSGPASDASTSRLREIGGKAAETVGFVAARFPTHRLGPESNTYEGSVIPPASGGYVIQVEDIAIRPGEGASSTAILVEQPNLEGRQPEADHETLGRMAESTGGRVIDLDQLGAEFGSIRDRNVQIPDDIIEPLWDSKVVLVLFALMISMEWTLRKAFQVL